MIDLITQVHLTWNTESDDDTPSVLLANLGCGESYQHHAGINRGCVDLAELRTEDACGLVTYVFDDASACSPGASPLTMHHDIYSIPMQCAPPWDLVPM